MATVSQPGLFTLQAFTSAGALGAGMRLYFYTTGTTTKKDVYTDSAGSTVHTLTSDGAGGEYLALDARGEAPAPIYMTTGAYDVVLKTAAGATVWTRRADPSAAETAIYTPAGTGATTRTVQDKLRESVSVLDFGAVGDGVADDTAEIQAAIDAVGAAGGGVVYLPPGTYLVSGTGTIAIQINHNNVTLAGAGQNTSTIKLANSQDKYTIYAADKTSLRFRDLTIDGNNSNQSAAGLSGLYTLRCSDLTCERVSVINAYGHGFFNSVGGTDSTLSKRIRYYNCYASGCGAVGNSATGTGFAVNSENVVLSGCTSEQNNLGGIKCTGSDVVIQGCVAQNNTSGGFTNDFDTPSQGPYKLIGCISRSNARHGFYFSSYSESVDVIGCNAEANGEHGFRLLNSVVNARFIGCEAKNNGQVTPSPGFLVESTNPAIAASKVLFSSVSAFDTQGTKTQTYGIYLNNDCDNIVIGEGSNLSDNRDGAFFSATTGQNITVRKGVVGLTSQFKTAATTPVTGTTAETDIISQTVKGGEMTRAGIIRFAISGGATGTNGTKQARFYVGSNSFLFYSRAAGETDDFFIEGYIYMNTNYSAIRRVVFGGRQSGTLALDAAAVTANTQSDWTIKVTGTLGDAADSVFIDSFLLERCD